MPGRRFTAEPIVAKPREVAVCRATYECRVNCADNDLAVYNDAAMNAMARGLTGRHEYDEQSESQ